jgi:hypothetical protein
MSPTPTTWYRTCDLKWAEATLCISEQRKCLTLTWAQYLSFRAHTPQVFVSVSRLSWTGRCLTLCWARWAWAPKCWIRRAWILWASILKSALTFSASCGTSPAADSQYLHLICICQWSQIRQQICLALLSPTCWSRRLVEWSRSSRFAFALLVARLIREVGLFASAVCGIQSGLRGCVRRACSGTRT